MLEINRIELIIEMNVRTKLSTGCVHYCSQEHNKRVSFYRGLHMSSTSWTLDKPKAICPLPSRALIGSEHR